MDNVIKRTMKKERAFYIASFIICFIVSFFLCVFFFNALTIIICIIFLIIMLFTYNIIYFINAKNRIKKYERAKNKKCIRCDNYIKNKLFYFSRNADPICIDCMFDEKDNNLNLFYRGFNRCHLKNTNLMLREVINMNNKNKMAFKVHKNNELISLIDLKRKYEKPIEAKRTNKIYKIGCHFGYDDKNKKIYIYDKFKAPMVFDYSDIEESRIIENGIDKVKGELTGAIVGNMAAGLPGMIVGASIFKEEYKIETSLLVVIITKSANIVTIDLLDGKKYDSCSKKYQELYECANKICNKLNFIINMNH